MLGGYLSGVFSCRLENRRVEWLSGSSYVFSSCGTVVGLWSSKSGKWSLKTRFAFDFRSRLFTSKKKAAFRTSSPPKDPKTPIRKSAAATLSSGDQSSGRKPSAAYSAGILDVGSSRAWQM